MLAGSSRRLGKTNFGLGHWGGHMCKKRKNTLAEFIRNYVKTDEGATAIEYAMLTAILGVGLIAGADGIGNVVSTMWDTVSTRMSAS